MSLTPQGRGINFSIWHRRENVREPMLCAIVFSRGTEWRWDLLNEDMPKYIWMMQVWVPVLSKVALGFCWLRLSLSFLRSCSFSCVPYEPRCVQAWAEGLKKALCGGFAYSPGPHYPCHCNNSPIHLTHTEWQISFAFHELLKAAVTRFKFLVSSSKYIFKESNSGPTGMCGVEVYEWKTEERVEERRSVDDERNH